MGGFYSSVFIQSHRTNVILQHLTWGRSLLKQKQSVPLTQTNRANIFQKE